MGKLTTPHFQIIEPMFRALFNGWLGEKVTQAGLWCHLDERVYRRFHDVIVPARSGTTQIDHVLVSVYGIFVIETKNYEGWIFGDEHSPQWTVSHFGTKFRFQNPLRQNYHHIQCLREYLQLDQSIFHSVVFFIGDGQLKTPLPKNVMTEGLSTYIRGFAVPCLGQEVATQVVSKLASLKADPTLTKASHLQSLSDRHSSTTICPRCGAGLVKRVARQGANAGKPFLGCRSFPSCKYTKAIP